LKSAFNTAKIEHYALLRSSIAIGFELTVTRLGSIPRKAIDVLGGKAKRTMISATRF